MVKLPEYDDDDTMYLRDLIAAGRRPKAIEFAQRILRDGSPTKRFLAAVADLLEPPANPRNRPKSEPWRWYQIGSEVQSRIAGGSTYEQAVIELAEIEHVSERTIERKVGYYRQVMDEVAEATRE